MRPIIALVGALSLSLGSACAGVRTAADEVPIERACAGLADAELDAAMAHLGANVVGVEALREDEGAKRVPRTIGAALRVRATPGMTLSWLGRVLSCQAARGELATCGVGETCPLTPPGAHSEVTATQTGFVVAIRSRDAEVAVEIGRRARALEQWGRGVEAARRATSSMQ